MPSHSTLSRLVTQHTANVCRTMLGLEVDAQPAPPAAAESHQPSVLALIGVTGPWNGTGTIACPASLACDLSGRFLMTTFEAVDAEVLDAMGELANMIIGNVKEDLAAEFGTLAISTPTVIHGEGLQTRGVRGETWTTVRFACGGDAALDVSVSLVPSAGAVRPADPHVSAAERGV